MLNFLYLTYMNSYEENLHIILRSYYRTWHHL